MENVFAQFYSKKSELKGQIPARNPLETGILWWSQGSNFREKCACNSSKSKDIGCLVCPICPQYWEEPTTVNAEHHWNMIKRFPTNVKKKKWCQLWSTNANLDIFLDNPGLYAYGGIIGYQEYILGKCPSTAHAMSRQFSYAIGSFGPHDLWCSFEVFFTFTFVYPTYRQRESSRKMNVLGKILYLFFILALSVQVTAVKAPS